MGTARTQGQQETKETKATRIRGTVKWFSAAKGYGFIARADQPVDVFVHFSEISAEGFRELYQGQTVEFEVVDSSRGPKATNVTVEGNC